VIVTDIPGTTRDAVEESLDIQGIPVTIIDTAGLQDTDDPVERIGVQKSLQMIERSDMVLFVVDGSRPPVAKERELFQQMPRGRTLLVINKGDKMANAAGFPCPEEWADAPAVVISALYNRGIGALKEQVAAIALGKAADRVEFGILPNLRHKLFLEAAAEAVGRGVQALIREEPLELVALSIKEGLSNLGSILGLEVAEDILDHIFNRFCIGK
jgi:tRNA modification GTPase